MYPGEPGLEKLPSPSSFLGQLSPPASLLATDTEMSDQEVLYSTVRFLQSPSQSQNRLRPGGTQMPGKSDDKEFSVPWYLISRILGILCLLLLMTVIVLGTMIFQYTQEKHQQDEILQDLRGKYHNLQNDSYLKEELLINKTLKYDILKNNTFQYREEPELLLPTKNGWHTIKIYSKPLQNTDKLGEDHLSCSGVKWYYFITENKTWLECQQICRNYGLSFLKIDNEDELIFLRSQAKKKTYWIGLSYNERERKWKWSDNTTSGLVLNMWNFFSGRGKCAFLSLTRVENIDCLNTYACICEKRIDYIVSGLLETKEKRP